MTNLPVRSTVRMRLGTVTSSAVPIASIWSFLTMMVTPGWGRVLTPSQMVAPTSATPSGAGRLQAPPARAARKMRLARIAGCVIVKDLPAIPLLLHYHGERTARSHCAITI